MRLCGGSKHFCYYRGPEYFSYMYITRSINFIDHAFYGVCEDGKKGEMVKDLPL